MGVNGRRTHTSHLSRSMVQGARWSTYEQGPREPICGGRVLDETAFFSDHDGLQHIGADGGDGWRPGSWRRATDAWAGSHGWRPKGR